MSRQRIKVGHINLGWEDADFVRVLDNIIREEEKKGYFLKDIKIESKGHNTLIIFELRDKEIDIIKK